jgi:hypothetical protein
MSDRLLMRTRTDSLASHILPVSGTMIGVCVTLIVLARIAAARHGTSQVDQYSAIAAITFLASALTSYLSIRYASRAARSMRARAAATPLPCGAIRRACRPRFTPA